MCGVDGSAAGVAPEDAENSDAFVRAKRGALARNGILGAGNCPRKSDAIFSALNVVVIAFGMPMTRKP